MKKIFLFLPVFIYMSVAFGQTGRWTWLKGDSTYNSPGFYGAKDVSLPMNNPPAREGAVTWADDENNLWLFGGSAFRSVYNDLWRYNIKTKMWTWVSGSNDPNQLGIYGQQRLASKESRPGARHGGVGWIDRNGNLWLFGGEGYDRQEFGYLCDLWMYSPKKDTWVWMSGSDFVNRHGIYGTPNVFDKSYRPGGRVGAVGWADNENSLFYLFGGTGYSADPKGYLNDMWLYNIREDVWTWISGSKLTAQLGQYAVRGDLSRNNMPGSREYAIAWRDPDNHLWLFGGEGYASKQVGMLNDMWRFDTRKRLWEWSGGSADEDDFGSYGRKGVTDPSNWPSGRTHATGFTDRAGNRWIFGGYNFAGEAFTFLNDLWKQDRDTRRWTWISGDIEGNQPGRYGKREEESEFNKPGARQTAAGWSDREDNLYVFGGRAPARRGYHNDLWIFRPIILRQQPEIHCPGNLIFRLTEKGCTVRPSGLVPKVLYIRDTTVKYRLTGATKGQGTGIVNVDFNLGITTVKYSLANDSTIQCSFTVTVVDRLAPKPTRDTLPDLLGDCFVEITRVPIAIDNCAGEVKGKTKDPLNYDTPGTHLITWTYEDGNGNSRSQVQRVIISDKTAPRPTVEKLPTLSGECQVRINKKPTALDECDGTITGETKDSTVFSTPGTRTITWVYRDKKGNVSRQSQTIVVKESSGKLVPLLDSLPDLIGECSAQVTEIPKAAKNCGGVVNAKTIDPLRYDKQGTYTIKWIYQEGDGEQLTQTQKVVVKDVTDPIPTLRALPELTGDCFVRITTIPTANDNCSGKIIARTNDPLEYSRKGTYTITWFYFDNNNNVTTQKQKVTIRNGSGELKPVVEILPDIVGECSATVTTIPNATATCGATVKASTKDPLRYDKQGTYTINWTYQDGDGEQLTQTQKVIVKDVTDPIPTLRALPELTGDCLVKVTTIPTANDNCAGRIIARTNDPLEYSRKGTYTITWFYFDNNNNVTTQQQKVTVRNGSGELKPVVEILPDIVGECSATVTNIPKATATCGATVTASTKDPLRYDKQGTYTIKWTYQDGDGEQLTQTQKVIVKDVTDPIPTLRALPELTGDCLVKVTTIPTANDNCAGRIIARTNDPLEYSRKGTYTITWFYFDNNNNVTTQQQKVTVRNGAGELKPIVEVLPDIVGECSVTVTVIPKANATCGATVSATTTDPLQYNKPGNYIINWTYAAENGNSIRQTQKVIIKDTRAPVPTLATLPELSHDCSITITTKPTANDNCAGSINATTTDPLTYTQKGTYTVRWRFNDGNGNQTIQEQKVVIKNGAATIPILTDLPEIKGKCNVQVKTKPTVKDGCGNTITATTNDPLIYTKAGKYTIHWSYKLNATTTRSQTQQVIVEDLSKPVPTADTLETVTGNCSARILSIPTASDDCVGSIRGTTTDPLQYESPGEYAVRWNYDDGNGNITTQIQRVVVVNSDLGLVVMPNPTRTKFTIIAKGCDRKQEIHIRVYDILGRVIEERNVDPFKTIELGERYPPATYIIQFQQGDTRAVVKVLKLRS